jgi:hypothetical protein
MVVFVGARRRSTARPTHGSTAGIRPASAGEQGRRAAPGGHLDAGQSSDLVHGVCMTGVRPDEHLAIRQVRQGPVDPRVEERARHRGHTELLAHLPDKTCLGRLSLLELAVRELPLSPLVLEQRDAARRRSRFARHEEHTLHRHREARRGSHGATAACRPRNRYIRNSGTAAATMRIDASAEAVPKWLLNTWVKMATDVVAHGPE